MSKPPNTVEVYYATSIFKGKSSNAKKAYNGLKKSEQKAINREYNAKVEAYVKQLKAYLGSLSKEDAVKYVSHYSPFIQNIQNLVLC